MHQARMPPRYTIAIVHEQGGAPAGKATTAANVNAGATRGIAANTPPPPVCIRVDDCTYCRKAVIGKMWTSWAAS